MMRSAQSGEAEEPEDDEDFAQFRTPGGVSAFAVRTPTAHLLVC